jgi:metal-responsive CopG/Arc/MetJ family transcriptional regulator
MKRITISIPENLATALAREARRRQESVSATVRRALRAHLAQEDGRLAVVALGRSGHRNTSRDAESILAGEWDRDRGR